MTELMLALETYGAPFRSLSGEEIADPDRIEACREALRGAWCSDATTDTMLVLADGHEIPWEALVAAREVDAAGVCAVLLDDVVYCPDERDEWGVRMRAVYAAPTVGPLGPEIVWDADRPESGPLRAGAGSCPIAPWADRPAFIYALCHEGFPTPGEDDDGFKGREEPFEMIEACLYTDSDIVAYGLRG